MTEAIGAVRRALDQAREERRRWERVVRDLESSIRQIESAHQKMRNEPAAVRTEQFSYLPAPAAAEIVLREAGRTMHISEMLEQLIARGYPKEDERRLYWRLFSALRRSEQIESVGRNRWRIAEETVAE